MSRVTVSSCDQCEASEARTYEYREYIKTQRGTRYRHIGYGELCDECLRKLLSRPASAEVARRGMSA